MAEGYFAHQLNHLQSSINVSSAGITALTDSPADPNARNIMQQRGIDISNHQGRQLTENLVRKTDLILVMTHSHLNVLTRQFMTAKGKTFLIGHWQDFEVKDPYTQPSEAFEKVYQQIELAWQDWNTRIL